MQLYLKQLLFINQTKLKRESVSQTINLYLYSNSIMQCTSEVL